MELWQQARDQGKKLPFAEQTELESLVEAELNAAAARTNALMQQGNYGFVGKCFLKVG